MMFKRATGTLLALMLLLSAVAGCSSTASSTNSPAATNLPATAAPASEAAATQAPATAPDGQSVDGIYKYNETVVIPAEMAYKSEYIKEGTDLWLKEWAKDKMNIDFQLEWKPEDAFKEQFPLYMAAGQYQPVLLLPYTNFEWTNILKFGEQEKIFQPLQKYFTDPDIMPVLSAIMAEPDIQAALPAAMTLDGNMFSAPQFGFQIQYATGSNYEIMYLDTRVADKLEMKVPTSTDELLAFLRAVKEKDPMGLGANNVPLEGAAKGSNPFGAILNAFGFNQDYFKYEELVGLYGGPYLPNNGKKAPTELGELVPMQTHPSFLEFLKYAHTLFSEGLLEPEFFTLEGQQSDAKMMANYAAIGCGWSNYIVDDDSYRYYVPLVAMTSPVSDKRMMTTSASNVYAGSLFIVTDKATEQQTVALMRFLDNAYNTGTFGDKKTYLSDRFGKGPNDQYGENTYGVVPHGFKYMFPDNPWDNSYMILDVKTDETPDGIYPDENTYLARIGWMWGSGGGMNSRRQRDFTKIDTSTSGGFATVQMADYITPYYTRGIPKEQYPTDIQTRMIDLKTVISEHVKTEIARFITGDRPCTDAEFAAYGNELKALGYDEYCKNFIDNMNGRFRPKQ